VTDIKEAVRQRYAGLAVQATEGQNASCCSSGSYADSSGGDTISGNIYALRELDGIPEAAVLASLGCGNPTALADLRPGETGLDLGSGGGIDVLLSARRVGPTGKAYGLDMTDEMLALAERNRAAAGVDNVEFLKGEIEAVPLPDASVDVIISNCVINLSADKDRVLREAYRVLKPGGRLAVSDVMIRGKVPATLRSQMEAWIGRIAGALEDGEYEAKLRAAGFSNITLEVTRAYGIDDVPTGAWDPTAQEREALDGKFAAAFIRAVKSNA